MSTAQKWWLNEAAIKMIREFHIVLHTHIYREPRLDVRGIQDSLKENISPC